MKQTNVIQTLLQSWMSFHLKLANAHKTLYVCFAAPMETQASFRPEDKLGNEYADLSSEISQQLIHTVTTEVRFIHLHIVYK